MFANASSTSSTRGSPARSRRPARPAAHRPRPGRRPRTRAAPARRAGRTPTGGQRVADPGAERGRPRRAGEPGVVGDQRDPRHRQRDDQVHRGPEAGPAALGEPAQRPAQRLAPGSTTELASTATTAIRLSNRTEPSGRNAIPVATAPAISTYGPARQSGPHRVRGERDHPHFVRGPPDALEQVEHRRRVRAGAAEQAAQQHHRRRAGDRAGRGRPRPAARSRAAVPATIATTVARNDCPGATRKVAVTGMRRLIPRLAQRPNWSVKPSERGWSSVRVAGASVGGGQSGARSLRRHDPDRFRRSAAACRPLSPGCAGLPRVVRLTVPRVSRARVRVARPA